jgi:transcriptional regulator with XRE-family HTH domain
MSFSVNQLRAARGLLNLTQEDLAERSGVASDSIKKFEIGYTKKLQERTALAIENVFEKSGVELLDGEGVRFRRPEVQIFKGIESFTHFFDFVYETVKDGDSEIFQCRFRDDDVIMQAEEWIRSHIARVGKVKNLDCRVLLDEGDLSFPCEYAIYRWLPQTHASTVPFYLFNHKLAFFILDRQKEPMAVLMDVPALAEAFRGQFLDLWESARVPPVEQANKSSAKKRQLSRRQQQN